MKKFLLLFVTLLVCIFSLDAQQIQPSSLRQIEPLQQEKESRTQDYASGTDEGRAMANIVHDLAPGAQLFFATADVGGQPGFAQAMLNLRAAGIK